MPRPPGVFTVSLDFELAWGIHPSRLGEYHDALAGGRRVVPRLLELFERYGIHATWATVGLLFYDSRDELRAAATSARAPADSGCCSYSEVIGSQLGPDENSDPLHYGRSVLLKVLACPHQEIGTHTFGHYYCGDDGGDVLSFRRDMEAALRAGREIGCQLTSLVFPRNQIRQEYLPICGELGIRAYRGVQVSTLYDLPNSHTDSLLKRRLRLLDAAVNVTGHHISALEDISRRRPHNIPASRSLRPYDPRLATLQPLFVRRIKRGLKQAATSGGVYHLWWHPHNFGRHTERNLSVLREILECFVTLRDECGMLSLNMEEIVRRVAGNA